MILSTNQLVELYEGLVKPFGHPDPLGYMTRALLTSEGDPDFIDVAGKRGFLPVLPELALEMTGVTEVQSLQSNIITTLTMDRMWFDQFRNIDKMIVASQFGPDEVNDELSKDQKVFVDSIDDARADTYQLMYPPMATVKDVIEVLNLSRVDRRLTTGERDFFELLLRGK